MTQSINQEFRKMIEEIIKIRRKFHQLAELSYKEYKTTAYIEEILTNWGLKFQNFENLDTGGFCEIGEGAALLFRSDIDGLPIEEAEGHSVKSDTKGTMHACGHDFHIAIGLGLLSYFQQNPNELQGRLRVIFQPAEEAAPGGAEFVKKEDIWQNARHILGVHVDNQYPTGKVIVPEKAASASSTSVKIELIGPGGHTSRPDDTVDLINVCGEYITALQNHLNSSIDPRETISFAFGKIEGGDTHNAIPQKIELRGTLRAHKNSIEKKARNIIKDFTKNFARLYNIEIDLQFPTRCPATNNDPEIVDKIIKFMENRDKSNLIIQKKASMGADDFAVYLDKLPGMYIRIGAGGQGEMHTGELLLEEQLLEPALNYLTGFIEFYFDSGSYK